MSEVLFPARARCKSCRKGLGANRTAVLMGLYCSPRCAGMAEPATSAANAPRECRTQRDGRWEFKRRYRSVTEIPDRLREDPSTSWYWCGHCGHLHIGHTRMGEAEQFRMFQRAEDLGDVLVKLRGHATRTQVAKAAGIRPIRLKEMEDGSAPVDPKMLLAVLRVLGATLGVAISQRRR